MYWEGARSTAAAAGQAPPQVSLPVAFTLFPGEIFQAPRNWVEEVYPNLIYFHRADRGGHFAPWEQPQPFSEEDRAGFRPPRWRSAYRRLHQPRRYLPRHRVEPPPGPQPAHQRKG